MARAHFIAGSFLIAAAASAPAAAQSQLPASAEREIRLVVGFPPGGGVDAYARLVAAHLGSHLPGTPLVVVSHMPGANSLTAANWLYNSAPRDGSVIGAIHSTVATEPLYGSDKVRFDISRFTWLGSASTDSGVMMTWGAFPAGRRRIGAREHNPDTSRTTAMAQAGPDADGTWGPATLVPFNRG
jgi:tripartite-type tricarboxylate transporter receptor subunit TctC